MTTTRRKDEELNLASFYAFSDPVRLIQIRNPKARIDEESDP